MPEYIYEIEEDQSDESEIFIGWIRRHSEQLIRCKNCKHYEQQYTDGFYTGNCQYNSVAETNGYCHMAERKEE